jgi:hypothetical protein
MPLVTPSTSPIATSEFNSGDSVLSLESILAAIANVVLNDAQGTPVAHTFAPAKTQSDFALLEDRSAGLYIGYNKLTFKLTRPQGAQAQKTSNRNLTLEIKVETPKMETVSNNTVSGIAPAPTVSYRPVATLNVTLPDRCSLQDRKDLQKYVLQLLSNSFVTDAFEKYELPY